jgi:hypothetical protein
MVLANFIAVFMKLSYKCLTLYFNQFLLLSIRGSCLYLLNRSVIQCNGMNTHIPSHKGPISHDIGFKLLVTRAIMNSFSVALAMGSLKYIPIGVASALQNISPIITFFLQRLHNKKVPLPQPRKRSTGSTSSSLSAASAALSSSSNRNSSSPLSRNHRLISVLFSIYCHCWQRLVTHSRWPISVI